MAEFEKKPVMEKTPEKAAMKKDVEGFLFLAKKRLDKVISAESINRKNAVEDLRFKKGDQWDSSMRASRTLEKRPCITINKMKTFVHQIVNDQRQNRPAINISPIGDRSDLQTAKMLKGLIKQIERQSNADIAYDTAFDSAVSGGWGYWRITTEYESEDSFDQVLKIKSIRNPFRVYMDYNSQEPDGSDAQWCFISDMIPREEFTRTYPKADPMNFTETGTGDALNSNWSTDTHVRIAEYYITEYETRTLIGLENGHVGYKDELSPDVLEFIKENPGHLKSERDVQCTKIKWYKITAKEILEESEWLGKYIPVVKVVGDVIDVEGKVDYSGIIRDAKDPQRMYNFMATSEVELTALQPKAPFIMEEGQVEGHEKRWQDANNKSFPYLLYKASSVSGKPAPPPQRQPFSGAPQGVIQAKVAAAQDMQAVTGIRFDATEQERLYDESGKALRELKRVGDLGSFHYIDNLARSLKYAGQIYIDAIPKYYDTKRVLTIIRDDGTEEKATIDPTIGQPYMEQEVNGVVKKLYNPKMGLYDVAVTIGPNYSTKRAEAVDSMIAFLKVDPAASPLIADQIAKNMDWEGSQEIAARLASRLPPNLLNSKIKDFPPEAKAMINALQTQMQQLGGKHMQAMKLLTDETADRQLEKYRIDKEFEAKLTKVAADFEAKMTNALQGHLQMITDSVQAMESKFNKGLQ